MALVEPMVLEHLIHAVDILPLARLAALMVVVVLGAVVYMLASKKALAHLARCGLSGPVARVHSPLLV